MSLTSRGFRTVFIESLNVSDDQMEGEIREIDSLNELQNEEFAARKLNC